MELDYFHEFVTLADAGNFSEAANKLSLSQSVLSKHLKSMEKELDETLILRTTKRFHLTEYGQLFLQDARKIAAVQQHYKDMIEESRQTRPGFLRIGSISMMPHYNLTSLFAGYKEKYPAIHLDVFNGREEDLTDALLRNRCEMAFMRFCTLPETAVEQIPLIEDYSCVVLSKNHPYSNCKTISLEQLKEEQFILLGGSRGPSGVQVRLFHESGFSPTNTMHLINYANILDLVRSGIGITVMTLWTARFLADDSLAIIPLSPQYKIELSLYYRKKHVLSPVASLFASYVRDHKEELFHPPLPAAHPS